jgi:putative chitinase
MKGEAADILAQGLTPRQLCEEIITLALPFDQLILEFDQWTHVSYSPRMRGEVKTARSVQGSIAYFEGIV